MKSKRLLTLWAVTALAISAVSTSFADTAEYARKIMEDNQNAVVTVQLVIETTASYQGQSEKQETKASATGTIIDPSGLVVTSVTSINPRDRFADLMDSGDQDYKMSTKVVDVKIKLGDGTEIPANLVLQDRDLDMAFIKPKTPPSAPFAFVDLTQPATPLAIDELVFLFRLGQVGNRTLAAGIERVAAVVTKPRLCYAIPGSASPSFGVPAFALDGKPVGITVLRSSMSKDQSSGFATSDKMLAIVLPCSTIQKAAEQAKTAVPQIVEETKPEPKAAKPNAKPATPKAK